MVAARSRVEREGAAWRTGRDLGARGALALLAALAPAAPVSAAPTQDEPEDEREVRSFAIPQTSEARVLMDQARTHLAAERWSDAIQVLQTLLERHRGEVLGPRSGSAAGEFLSQQPVHEGASTQAARMLVELPEEARALYLDRYGPESRGALERARRAADRGALIEVARRYPLTPAAREAWWSVGDLELELGELEAARAAWSRAAHASQAAGEELGEGARARLDFAYPAELEEPMRVSTESADDDGAPPGPMAQSWRVRFDAGPFNPGTQSSERFNLLPTLAGDTLLVSDSLRLYAIDAWTGRVRWESPEPPGWREVDQGEVEDSEGGELRRGDFFQGLDRDGVLIQAAAGGHVALAALQVPVTQNGNSFYRGIRITSTIPDRRLFAFDLDTGRELWNHMPPPGWDGESGRFEQRMMVAGPPVVVGSRVIVPTYRLQGRMDFHVACYDLQTGARLWSTGVISGQLPLNMFGRHAQELSAPPVVVHGEKVLAQTQLGAVAALDLYSGDILWETLYESLPLPKNFGHYEQPKRPRVWNNAPPLLVDGVLIATPTDSRDLFALSVESGAMLWSIQQKDLIGKARERWTLIGAGSDSVYLAGTSILACRAPGGLSGTRPPTDVQASPELSSDPLPHPAFGERWIVAPNPARRTVLDRLQLRYENQALSLPWEPEQEYGNALLVEGALYMLTGKYLTCIYDWSVQERRFEAALQTNPGDHSLALAYSAMLLDRARRSAAGGDLAASLSGLDRARAELEPRIALDERGVRNRSQAALHHALRLEAEVRARQADSAGALERLDRAVDLAPSLEALRDTLIETARLCERRGDGLRRLETLAELERRCSALSYSPATSLIEPGAEELAPEDAIEVGQWVAVERARELKRSGDAAGELGELQRALGEWGDVRLGDEPLDPRVSARIGELIEERGRELYAPFEQRAQEALELALAEQDASGLERVARLYPHSLAARSARAKRLDLAWRAGDAFALAELLQAQLPERWSAARATDEELTALVQLAELLNADGNRDFAAGLLRDLADGRPDFVPPDPAGPSLLERASSASSNASADAAPGRAQFSASLTGRLMLSGNHRLIGKLPYAAPGALPSEVFVFVSGGPRRERLSGFLADDPQAPIWEVGVDRVRAGQGAGQLNAVLPVAIVVPGGPGLVAYDPLDGQPLWARELQGQSLLALRGDSGVVIANVATLTEGERLLALDARRGVELWSLPLPAELHSLPVVGPAHVVLLPRQAEQHPLEVRDLFTGRLAHADVPLDADVSEQDLRGAWIEEGLLVLPVFPRSGAPATQQGDALVGIDLAKCRRAWRVPRSDKHELDSIVRFGRDTYLVRIPSNFSPQPAKIAQVDTRLGAQRDLLADLAPGDAPLGVRPHTVIDLDEPYLYVIRPALENPRESRLRAIHLPYGELWTRTLQVLPDDLFNAPPPLPVHSESTLALAFTQVERSQGVRAEPRTLLLLLDRASGLQRDERVLTEDLGRADALRLFAGGRSLFLEGQEALQILSE